jgi:hypothetical protein
MRTSLATLLALVLLASHPVIAQDADPLPESAASDPAMPEETDAMTLIPENPDAVQAPDYSDLEVEVPAFEEIPMPADEEYIIQENKEGKALQNRILFFETRVKAGDDPAVQAERLRAQTVRTFPEQRDAMFNYYTLLYARMEKLAPDLEAMIETQRQSDYNKLKQSLIRPSEWPVPPPNFPTPAPQPPVTE